MIEVIIILVLVALLAVSLALVDWSDNPTPDHAEIERLTAEIGQKDSDLHDAAVYLRECGKQFASLGDHVMQAGCYAVAERVDPLLTKGSKP